MCSLTASVEGPRAALATRNGSDLTSASPANARLQERRSALARMPTLGPQSVKVTRTLAAKLEAWKCIVQSSTVSNSTV